MPANVVTEQNDQVLVLQSIRNRVWNPVFTVGTISFVLSMTLRGFFDQHYATPVLGLSALILFWGVWILSAHAMVAFDRQAAQVFFVYKHLGYLQKVYALPLASLEAVLIAEHHGQQRLTLLLDNGSVMPLGRSSDRQLLEQTASQVAKFLNVPLQRNP